MASPLLAPKLKNLSPISCADGKNGNRNKIRMKDLHEISTETTILLIFNTFNFTLLNHPKIIDNYSHV